MRKGLKSRWAKLSKVGRCERSRKATFRQAELLRPWPSCGRLPHRASAATFRGLCPPQHVCYNPAAFRAGMMVCAEEGANAVSRDLGFH
jgi:hypothetical protein